MTDDRIYLTREGYEKLKSELDFLQTKKRRQIAEDLKRARAFGDLRENGEYESAKHAQALNEKRIAELGTRLMRAQIVSGEGLPADQALIGATVTLEDAATGEQLRYTLVSAAEADYKENKLSIASPVGKAILGRKVGDAVSVRVPAGELKYKVLKIER
jgi:transcription elongation factor GreA